MGQIDAQGFKGNTVKLYKDNIVKAFSTIPEIRDSERAIKGGFILNIVMAPKKVETVNLNDIKYYKKYHFSHEWFCLK